MQLPWYQRPPDAISLEEANEILQDPAQAAHFPNQWDALLSSVKDQIQVIKEQSKSDNPLAWIQPSYEQNLKLNAWIYGVDYVVDFDANRMGKTTGGVINALLWILPYEQITDAIMFSPFTDHKGRTFQTIPRPPITAMKGIRETLAANNLKGDPRLPLEDPVNLSCYKITSDYLKSHPPIPSASKRTIWVGGPDNEWNQKNIVVEWHKWTPKHNIRSSSTYNHELILEYPQPSNKVYPTAVITVLFKSYDSEDTKWSGGAVDGIMMSEGIPATIFSEIKQRYKYPAFASWDYTPYEPRNTAGKSGLAHKVFKGEEPLPLTPYVYSGFGIEDVPAYIMDEDKRRDLIKNWQGKPEGDARIKGIFYSSSPIVLKNYDPLLHALPGLTLDDLRKKYAPKPLILFRGVDPGWGHVTSCAWMALAPDNTKYIYKIYSRSQRSIEERCTDIIDLSGNKRVPHPKAKAQNLWQEESTPSTHIKITFIDYHTFKTDEVTKRAYAYNYIQNGLVVRPSITFGPKERALLLNDLLQPQLHLPHPTTNKPPGSKVFFLVDGDGVATALNKMANIFYQTFERGEKRGLTKDAIQDYDDDELDAVCYVTCPVLLYQSFVTSQKSDDSGTTSTSSRLSFTSGIITPAEYSRQIQPG